MPKSLNTNWRVGKCGFIFEFLLDGDIICAILRDGQIRLLDKENSELITLIKINDAYIGEQGEGPRERGLVGLTLDPDFTDNNYVYLHWTYKNQVDQKQYKKVARFVYNHARID